MSEAFCILLKAYNISVGTALRIPCSAGLFHQLALKCLILAVFNGRGLFIVLPLFKFTDNTFLFDHALKTLDCLFKVFGIFNYNVSHAVITSFRSLTVDIAKYAILCHITQISVKSYR